jgi:acyl-coenzyme A thioesterase PaaI-like protein
VATIDMRVDYLRPADPADLIAIGEVKLLGNRVGNATVQIFSAANPEVVIAEGRGVYNIRKAGAKAPDAVRAPAQPPVREEVS